MIGAILGDIAGSVYEFHNVKSKDIPFFLPKSRMTDDSVMTLAVADALLESYQDGYSDFQPKLIASMQRYGRRFPHAGYGMKFYLWLGRRNPQPYGSWGNGSGMRVSPCADAAVTLEETLLLAKASAEVTHNAPEGIQGAQAIAAAAFLARTGSSKEEIRDYIREHFYPLDRTLDEIRPEYCFDVSCPGSCPQAIQAFLESTDYEDALRNAISLGGDSDTIACMTGAIAEGFYFQSPGVSKEQRVSFARYLALLPQYLPEDCIALVTRFQKMCSDRRAAYRENGSVPSWVAADNSAQNKGE